MFQMIWQLINFGGVCLKKSEPILNRTPTDRLRFAPAERSGMAEFLPPTPSFRHALALKAAAIQASEAGTPQVDL